MSSLLTNPAGCQDRSLGSWQIIGVNGRVHIAIVDVGSLVSSASSSMTRSHMISRRCVHGLCHRYQRRLADLLASQVEVCDVNGMRDVADSGAGHGDALNEALPLLFGMLQRHAAPPSPSVGGARQTGLA